MPCPVPHLSYKNKIINNYILNRTLHKNQTLNSNTSKNTKIIEIIKNKKNRGHNNEEKGKKWKISKEDQNKIILKVLVDAFGLI